jgi:hypothetical protein
MSIATTESLTTKDVDVKDSQKTIRTNNHDYGKDSLD